MGASAAWNGACMNTHTGGGGTIVSESGRGWGGAVVSSSFRGRGTK